MVLAFLVISGFLISLGLFYFQTRRIGKQVKKGLRLIEECSLSPDQNQTQDPLKRDLIRKQRFASQWTRFQRGMLEPDMHFFASAWAEFQKHLTLPTTNAALPIRTTAEPALYFNERSLYFVNINSRLYDAIPGFLTGGGIFGTFVGLVAGIYLAQDGMSAGPQEMKQAMKFLMGGVSTAFLTSIFGIGLSILFSILEKRRQHWVGRLVQRFSEQLETCLEMSHDENSGLSRIHTVQMEQLIELRKLCQILKAPAADRGAATAGGAGDMDTRIGASLAPALGKMFETLVRYQDNQRSAHQDSLQSALAPLLDQLQSTLAQKLGSIELGLFSLNENLRKQQELQTGLWEDLRDGSQKGLLDTARNIRESMDGLGVSMSTLMRESAEGSFGRLDQAVQTLTGAVNDMKNAQQQLHQDLVGAVTRIEVDQQSQTDQKIQTFAQNVSSLHTSLDQHNERLALSLKDAAHTLKETLDHTQNFLSGKQRQSAKDLDDLWHRGLSSLADVASNMKHSQMEVAAILKDSTVGLKDSTSGLSGRLERTIADLADVAAGMRSAQVEMSVALRDSSTGLAGRMERTMTDLGAVAAGMKSAQMELVGLLRESANSFSGQMSNSLEDLARSSTAMLAVQNEMQRIFGAAPHLLVATEKLLNGMERFQEQVGSKIDTLASTQSREDGARMNPETLLDHITRLMERSRATEDQDVASVSKSMVVAGELILHAAESLEQTAAGMASHFATSINHLSSNQAEMISGFHASSDGITSRLDDALASLVQHFSSNQAEMMRGFHDSSDGISSRLDDALASLVNRFSSNQAEMIRGFHESSDGISSRLDATLASLKITMEGVRHAMGELQRSVIQASSASAQPQPVIQAPVLEDRQMFQQRFEEVLGGILHYIERMDANHQATIHSINDRNQAVATVLQQSHEKLNLGNEDLENLLQSTAVSFQQAASEINVAANRMSQTLQQSTRWSEESRHAIAGVIDFSSTFDQAQGRFGQMIDAMESGAMMIAVAGERLQTSSDKLERVSNAMNDTQETARHTLAAITKAHEQLRNLWHNYETRFEGVDESLGRTFVNLNNGLQEFSDRVLQFISGVDDHMGGISEKLGYSIGDFGTKLEDLNDSMSGFLEKMSTILIRPIQETARQVALAGNRIHDTIQSVEQLSHSISITEGTARDGAEQTLAAFQDAQERMKSTIAMMQNQLQSTWAEHQNRFDQVNASMQQTMASINSDLEDFSSEKILEFIGGVDEHMESVSQQLKDTIGDFNSKLDDLNDSMSFFVQTLSSVK
ncbi:MAG: hypothetical protein HQL98_13710 [Magnetococcales bacterium]|nr:hypothetical protein [Magnetococcales bacterium]